MATPVTSFILLAQMSVKNPKASELAFHVDGQICKFLSLNHLVARSHAQERRPNSNNASDSEASTKEL